MEAAREGFEPKKPETDQNVPQQEALEVETPLAESAGPDHRKVFVDRVANLDKELQNSNLHEKRGGEASRQDTDTVQKIDAFTELREAAGYVTELVREECGGYAIAKAALQLPAALAGVATPFLLGEVVEQVATQGTINPITGAALLAVPAVVSVSQSLYEFVQMRMTQRLFYGQKSNYVEQVHSIAPEQRLKPEVDTEVEKQRENLGRAQNFADSLFNIGATSITAASAFVLMASVDPVVACAVVAGTAPLFGLEKKRSQQANASWDEVGKVARDLWPISFETTEKDTVSELQVHRKSNWAVQKVRDLGKKIININDRLTASVLKLSLQGTAINAAVSVSCGAYVLSQAARGDVNADGVIKFLGGVAALQGSVSMVRSLWGRLIEDAPFINRLFKLGEAQCESKTEEKKQFTDQEVVEFREKLQQSSVGIRFTGVKVVRGDNCILDIDELTLEPGSFVGIVGRRGAGKSTLINTLLGIYKPTVGNVELLVGDEKHSLSEIPLEAWHSVIGYNPQEGYRGGSLPVAEFVRIGLNEEDEKPLEMSDALAYGGALEVLSADEAEEVKIGSHRKFSGGEVKSFANSRAFIGNRKVLVLDEPTSNLDVESEAELIDNLENLGSDKMLLLISHRFNTLNNADKILVIDGGRVAEYGSHDELIEKEGAYRKLYDLAQRNNKRSGE